MRRVTERQQQVQDFIEQHIADEGVPPTDQEIADYFGWRSATSAVHHIEALIAKGRLERRKNRHRGLRVVRKNTLPRETHLMMGSVSGQREAS